MRRALLAVAVTGGCLFAGPAAQAERSPYPHEFTQNNMGYCAPFLAQLRTPWDGSPVRPFINHTVQEATKGDGTFDGQRNLGDLYSDRARSETDRLCLPRR
jgi:hypothetical protein